MSAYLCHSAYVFSMPLTLASIPTARYHSRSATHGNQVQAFYQLRGFVTSNTATKISPFEKGPLRQKTPLKYQHQHDVTHYLRPTILNDDDRPRSYTGLQSRTNQLMIHMDDYPMRSYLTTCFSETSKCKLLPVSAVYAPTSQEARGSK